MSEQTTQNEEQTISFKDLELDERLVRAVEGMGFETPTPIQAAAIPHLMDRRDIIGGARTGSGKTAAFGLPLLHHLSGGGKRVRALILAPTRELALQVSGALEDLAKHLPVKILTVYGGVGYRKQLQALKSGVSVVVGTPGRVIDHLERGTLKLNDLELLVLDEADEMLQMGFIDDIERVLKAAPADRQVALFSATMPKPIKRVAQRYLTNPVTVQVESKALTTSHITQRWIQTNRRGKQDALARLLMAEQRDAALVFARTRASCAQLAEQLMKKGFSVDALHGDMNQGARELVMTRLRARQIRVVVATDVAARGLDVNHITHVINYDLPENSEIYAHRIGRTARAGREGKAITFVANNEKGKFGRLQRDLNNQLEYMAVPTDAQIAYGRRETFLEDLDQTIQAQEAVSWFEKILEEKQWTPEQVAQATLAILAKKERVLLAPQDKPKERPAHSKPPEYSKSERKPRDNKSNRSDEHFATLNEVELYFPAGRRDGLRPSDFVGALCNEAHLPSDCIGRITLGGHKTFVGLPTKVATELLDRFNELKIRDEVYTLQMSSEGSGSNSNRGGGGNSQYKNKGKYNKRRKNKDKGKRKSK